MCHPCACYAVPPRCRTRHRLSERMREKDGGGRDSFGVCDEGVKNVL